MLNNDPVKKYLVIGTLVFLSVVFIRSSISSLGRNKRLTLLKEEVSDLVQEKKRLEEDISYKQTEEYIEDRARTDLNLIKPDEKVYIVINERCRKRFKRSALGFFKKGY